jgi:uncharacterized protein
VGPLKYQKHMLAVCKIIENKLPRHSLLASLVDRANLSIPHNRTCGVGQNYLVFNHRGQISQCQMTMDDVLADVCDPEPLLSLCAPQNGIVNMSVDEKGECRECEWRYWCAGGCPVQAYRFTGRYDAKSPYCNIYKALYPEVIRLEGLRLLKYAHLV